MHIVQLTAENVKRLKAVQIKPDGAIVPITGRNGAGKSSVLDAIEYALGGKSAQPGQPVRRGAEKARVVLDLGDLRVKRTWSQDGGTYLSVESPNGAKYPSPQKMLDDLLGRLTFDPVAFSRMAAAEQVATLKDVAGVASLFAQYDADRDHAYDERRNVNRDAKTVSAQLTGMLEVDAPDEEVSIAELTEKHRAATALLRENDQIRQNAENLAERIRNGEEYLKQLSLERQAALAQQDDVIRRLEEQLAEAQTQRQRIDDRLIAKGDSALEMLRSLESDHKALQASVEQLLEPDVEAIAAELQQVEAMNARVREKKARDAKACELTRLDSKSKALTQEIDGIDGRKCKALAEASLPVDGLGFDESGVTLNGLPFEQASSAEQLRVSVAMGIALNPKLKVMLIRDGSLLDTQGRKLLAEMAQEHGYQVWLEAVSDGDGVGVVIEDGEVKAAQAEV